MLDDLLMADVEDAVVAAYEKGRQSVLVGLKALAELNGSAPAVMKHFDPDREDVLSKAWAENQHPRDRNGKFISKQTVDTLLGQPGGEARLRAMVKPGDEGKLDAQISAAKIESAHGMKNVRTPRAQPGHPDDKVMSPRAEKMAETVELAQQLAVAVKTGTMTGDIPRMAKDLGTAFRTMEPEDFNSLKDHLGFPDSFGPQAVAGRLLNTAAHPEAPEPAKPQRQSLDDALSEAMGMKTVKLREADERLARPSPDASAPLPSHESPGSTPTSAPPKSVKPTPKYGPWSADDLLEAAKPLRREMEESAHDPEAFLRAATEYGEWLKQFSPEELDGLAKALGHDTPDKDVGHLASKLAAKALRRENPEADGHTGVVHGEDGSQTHYVEGAVAATHAAGEAKPEPSPAVPDATADAVKAVPLTSSVDDIETHLKNPGPWARDNEAVKGRLAQRLTEPGQLEELATRVFGKNVAEHFPKSEQRGHLLDKLAEFAKAKADGIHGKVQPPPLDARQTAERLKTGHDRQTKWLDEARRGEGPAGPTRWMNNAKYQKNHMDSIAWHERQMAAHLKQHPDLAGEFGKYAGPGHGKGAPSPDASVPVVPTAAPPPSAPAREPGDETPESPAGESAPKAPVAVPTASSPPHPDEFSPGADDAGLTPHGTLKPRKGEGPLTARRQGKKWAVQWETPEGELRHSLHADEADAKDMHAAMGRDKGAVPGSAKIVAPGELKAPTKKREYLSKNPNIRAGTLADVVRRYGGLDPESFERNFGSVKEAIENGVPASVFKDKQGRKGRAHLDTLAQELTATGDLGPHGEDVHQHYHLLDQLTAGRMSANHYHGQAHYDKLERQYHREREEAHAHEQDRNEAGLDAHDPAAVEAAARGGEATPPVAEDAGGEGNREWRPARDRNRPLSDAEVERIKASAMVPAALERQVSPAEPSPDLSSPVPAGSATLFGAGPETFRPSRGTQGSIEDAYRENAGREGVPTTMGTAADLRPGEFGHTPEPPAPIQHPPHSADYWIDRRAKEGKPLSPAVAATLREQHRRGAMLTHGDVVQAEIEAGEDRFRPGESTLASQALSEAHRAKREVAGKPSASPGAKIDARPLAPHVANSLVVELATKRMKDPMLVTGYMNPHKDLLRRLGAVYVPQGRMWFVPRETVPHLPAAMTVRPVRGAVESKSVNAAPMELAV